MVTIITATAINISEELNVRFIIMSLIRSSRRPIRLLYHYSKYPYSQVLVMTCIRKDGDFYQPDGWPKPLSGGCSHLKKK